MNANQLAAHLRIDYRTVRHHLAILEKNGLVSAVGDGYGRVYYPSPTMEQFYPHLAEILKEGP